MRLILYILGALVTVGFGFWAYHVNYDTQSALRRVADLQQSIALERERMTMLRAEWAWLTRPERLEALVKARADDLLLIPLAPEHFGDVASVAFPPKPEPELPVGWDGVTREDIHVTDVGKGYDGPRPLRRPKLPDAAPAAATLAAPAPAKPVARPAANPPASPAAPQEDTP